jgi:hypothetical protein
MNRCLLVCGVIAAACSPAAADLGPRPKGPVTPTKLIPVNNALKFENEFPDHVFWAVTAGPNGTNVVPLKFDPKKPLPLTMNQTASAVVYAIPKTTAKLFTTPKEFVEAVTGPKLPDGVVASPNFLKAESAPTSDKRTTIKRVLVVTGNLTDGVKFSEEEAPAPKKDPEEPEQPTATRPAPRRVVVGLAAALAVAFAGAWLVRRAR